MSSPAISVPSPKRKTRVWSGDETARLLTLVFAASVLLVTVLLVWQLWQSSGTSRAKFGLHFLTGTNWDPVAGDFGALPFVYGTLLTSVLALLISVPLGVGAAIFLAELAPPKLAESCTFLVELLAAVPSVIYGLLGAFTIIPLLRDYVEPFLKHTLGEAPVVGVLFSGPSLGFGYLAAGVVLAVMTFPFIISISRESLLEVPRDQREAALALGATRWESTSRVVVPYARLGILGSIFLGLARALGETMAVTMVIGNDPNIHASLLASGYTIAAVIANEFTEAVGKLYQSSLVELGLVLFLITIIINALARLLVMATRGKGTGTAA
ncbi:MAG: phosphate ABC transporter permease subunit PstC [Bryobacteraceae bacterium]